MNPSSIFHKIKNLDYLLPYKRTPVSAATTVLLGLVSLVLVWSSDNTDDFAIQLVRILFFLYIAYLTSTGLHLFAERRKLIPPVHAVVIAIGLVFSIILAFSTFPIVGFHGVNGLQMFVLGASAFTFPFLFTYLGRSNHSSSFWRFSFVSLYRVLIVLFSISIFVIGILAAFGAVDVLLQISVDGRLMASVAAIGYAAVFPYLSLLAIPVDLEKKTTLENFPVAILRISQFVLIPLLVVFLIILYLYLIRVVFVGELPSNQFVPLTLGFLLPGFVAVIALFPLREEKSKRWVRMFIRLFSVSTLPLMGAYFYGIGVRLSEYGSTPPRIFVIIIGIYIICLAIYLVFAKLPRLNLIIFALILVLFVPTFTPLINVFSISEAAQYSRLEQELVEYDLLENGKLTGNEVDLSYDQYYTLSTDIEYIVGYYGPNGFSRWFEQNTLDSIFDPASTYYYREVNELLSKMGVNQDKYNDPYDNLSYYERTINRKDFDQTLVQDITDYDKFSEVYIYLGRSQEYLYQGFSDYEVGLDSNGVLTVTFGDKPSSVQLSSLIDKLEIGQNSNYYSSFDSEDLTIEGDGFKIIFDSIDLSFDQVGGFRFESIDGVIFVQNQLGASSGSALNQ